MRKLGEKTKWQRTGGPKVRTGCVTCKSRHLKCDETKPHCQRCKGDNFECEGYPPVRKRRAPNTAKQPAMNADSQFLARLMAKTSRSLMYRALISEAYESPSELHLFHHVRTYLTQDFTTVLTATDFWFGYALPLGHVTKPVRAALCALGSAHKQFKIQLSASCTSAPSALEEFSIQQYNEAINHIKNLSCGDQSNLDVVLVCCIIFICIENLLGRYAESLQHLKAAYALLGSQQQHHLTNPEHRYSETTSDARLALFNDVNRVLATLSQDTAMYTGHNAIPELTLYSTPKDLVEDPEVPFESVAIAARSLRNFEMKLTTGFTLCQRDATQSLADSHPGQPRLLFNTAMIELQDLLLYFRTWSAKFNDFKAQVDRSALSEKETYQLHAISVVQTIHSTFMDARPTKTRPPLEAYSRILDQMEDLIDSHGLKAVPTFSFDATIIPALNVFCTSCGDPGIQKRIVRILRSIRRREGLWNSQEVADVLEALISAQECGLVIRDSTPWHLFRTVEMLSCLPDQKYQVPVGLVRLAQSV